MRGLLGRRGGAGTQLVQLGGAAPRCALASPALAEPCHLRAPRLSAEVAAWTLPGNLVVAPPKHFATASTGGRELGALKPSSRTFPATGDRAAAVVAYDRVRVWQDAVYRAHGRAPAAVVAKVGLDPERRALRAERRPADRGGRTSQLAGSTAYARLGKDREAQARPDGSSVADEGRGRLAEEKWNIGRLFEERLERGVVAIEFVHAELIFACEMEALTCENQAV